MEIACAIVALVMVFHGEPIPAVIVLFLGLMFG